MVKSLAPSNGLSQALQSRTRRVSHRAAAAARAVPQRGWSAVVIYPAEVQLPKGSGGFPTYRSSIDTFASMTGTLQVESLQEKCR